MSRTAGSFSLKEYVLAVPRKVLYWGGGLTAVALVCILGAFLAPYEPNAGVGDIFTAPSSEHWLGTDGDGRDVLSRVLVGSRTSMLVALISVALGAAVGTAMGLLAAVTEGTILSTILVRFMDAILAFPFIVLAAVTAGITFGRTVSLGPVEFGQMAILTVVLALIQLPIFGRLARATALEENSKDYITAAVACGQTRRSILKAELFPNVLPALVVQGAFSVVIAISAEAAISYLGLGIQRPAPSWGNMMREGLDALVLGAWWIVAFPTAIVLVVSIALTSLGEALRHAMDPRAKKTQAFAAAPPPAMEVGEAGDQASQNQELDGTAEAQNNKEQRQNV